MIAAEARLQTASVRADVVLQAAARRDGPIVAGPWTSEVGFEVLYWIPLLRWLARRWGIGPERLTAVTRGGAGVWYAGLAGRTVELFEHVGVAELHDAGAGRERRSSSRKQRRGDMFDRHVLHRAGLEEATVLAPDLMYELFAPLWARRRPMTLLERRTVFAPLGLPPVPADRRDHIALKAYWSDAFPETPAHHRALDELVAWLAERCPVVVLSTGTAFDDHREYRPAQLAGVRVCEVADDPATNLAVQSQLVASARMLFAVHGGFAHLGPFLGTDTVAFHGGDGFIQAHEDSARRAWRALRAGGGAVDCVTVPVDGLLRFARLAAGAPGGPRAC